MIKHIDWLFHNLPIHLIKEIPIALLDTAIDRISQTPPITIALIFCHVIRGGQLFDGEFLYICIQTLNLFLHIIQVALAGEHRRIAPDRWIVETGEWKSFDFVAYADDTFSISLKHLAKFSSPFYFEVFQVV